MKINAANLFSLEVLPKYDFTSGAVVSQLPGFLFQLRIIWKDAVSHRTGMNSFSRLAYRISYWVMDFFCAVGDLSWIGSGDTPLVQANELRS